MRRIVLLVTVALLMAAMVALTAGPVFAGGGGSFRCNANPQGLNCQGGSGSGAQGGGGGLGGHTLIGFDLTFTTTGDAGGGGQGEGGGFGGRCSDPLFGGVECVGGGSG